MSKDDAAKMPVGSVFLKGGVISRTSYEAMRAAAAAKEPLPAFKNLLPYQDPETLA